MTPCLWFPSWSFLGEESAGIRLRRLIEASRRASERVSPLMNLKSFQRFCNGGGGDKVIRTSWILIRRIAPACSMVEKRWSTIRYVRLRCLLLQRRLSVLEFERKINHRKSIWLTLLPAQPTAPHKWMQSQNHWHKNRPCTFQRVSKLRCYAHCGYKSMAAAIIIKYVDMQALEKKLTACGEYDDKACDCEWVGGWDQKWWWTPSLQECTICKYLWSAATDQERSAHRSTDRQGNRGRLRGTWARLQESSQWSPPTAMSWKGYLLES